MNLSLCGGSSSFRYNQTVNFFTVCWCCSQWLLSVYGFVAKKTNVWSDSFPCWAHEHADVCLAEAVLISTVCCNMPLMFTISLWFFLKNTYLIPWNCIPDCFSELHLFSSPKVILPGFKILKAILHSICLIQVWQ